MFLPEKPLELSARPLFVGLVSRLLLPGHHESGLNMSRRLQPGEKQ